MQNWKIEELELDMEELKLLLNQVREDDKLIPLVKRHIGRFIKTLEDIRGGLDQSEKPKTVIVKEEPAKEKVVYVEEKESVKEEPVIIEKAVITTEVVEKPVEPKKSHDVPSDVVPSSSRAVLGEQLRPAAELSKGLSLNDTFRFSRELFNGDKDAMNEVLHKISRMNSLDDVVSYLSMHIDWDEENDVTKDFVELLKKYFV